MKDCSGDGLVSKNLCVLVKWCGRVCGRAKPLEDNVNRVVSGGKTDRDLVSSDF